MREKLLPSAEFAEAETAEAVVTAMLVQKQSAVSGQIDLQLLSAHAAQRRHFYVEHCSKELPDVEGFLS